MAPSAGFEPALSRSTGGCIGPGYAKTALIGCGPRARTERISVNSGVFPPGEGAHKIGLERSARIELASDAWKAPAQPLDQPRFKDKAVLPVQHRLGGLRVTLYASPAPRAGSSGASGLGVGCGRRVFPLGLGPRHAPEACQIQNVAICAGDSPRSEYDVHRLCMPVRRVSTTGFLAKVFIGSRTLLAKLEAVNIQVDFCELDGRTAGLWATAVPDLSRSHS